MSVSQPQVLLVEDEPAQREVLAYNLEAEGYQVRRLDRYGKPVCSGVAPPTYTAGDFKAGSKIRDPN